MNFERKLGMIGLGRLGLSIALCFETKGFEVFGYDVSLERTHAVNSKTHASREPGVEKKLKQSKKLKAYPTLKEAVTEPQVIYISVPTKSNPTSGEFDCTILINLLKELNKLKLKNKHFVICSTVSPRFTSSVGLPLLHDCENSTLSYLPDGAVPLSYGNLLEHISRPQVVLIGQGSVEAGLYLEWMHQEMVDLSHNVCCRMTPTSAEIAKLASSSFSALKVSFVNFLTELTAETEDCCIDDVLKVMQQDAERFGKAFWKPGPGFGGPCIPRDNRALNHFAAQHHVNNSLLLASETMNQVHAEFLANQMEAKKQASEVIVIEDVAFKEGCAADLIDDSRKLEVARILVKRGLKVRIRDRLGIIQLVEKEFGEMFSYSVKM